MAKKNEKKASEEEILENEEVKEETETAEAEDEQKCEAAEDENAKKYAELEDKYLRLMAEYKNYQSRTQREKDELYGRAVMDTVEKLLPVVDSVERAQSVGRDASSVEDVFAGVELIGKMTKEVFEKLGVEAIEAVGKEFDANYHNAVMHIDDENFGENEVVEEFMKGYKMKDKVIRYSMVKVAN